MKRHSVLISLLFAIAFCLSFFRLDSPAFWDDEAHVGLFARQFLLTHSTSAWDGRNLIPDRNAIAYDREMHYSLPQLDNYLVACSFKIFGKSTWSGRFPFALSGFAGLVIFWFLLKLEFPNAPLLQLYAFAAAISVNIFLYIRTCRYYGFSMLMALALFYCYKRFLRHRDWQWPIAFGICAGLLSLSSILNSICILGIIGLRHLVFHRKEITSSKDWLKVGTAAGVFCVFTVPYLFAYILPNMAVTSQADRIMGIVPPPKLVSAMVLTWWNIKGLNLINAFPWMLALIFLTFLYLVYCSDIRSILKLKSVTNILLEYFIVLLGYIIFLSILSPQPIDLTHLADVRYLAPVLPFIAILAGGTFWFIHNQSKLVALVIFLCYFTSNVLSIIPFETPFQWIAFDFVSELLHPFPTSCSEAAKFLIQNAKQDDTVWLTPNTMGKPILFYTGSLIKLRGFLDSRTMLQEPREAVKQLDPSLLVENAFPDWVVSFGAQPDTNPALSAFSRPHFEGGQLVSYTYRLVKQLNIYWGEIQRPELPWHHFGPLGPLSKETDAVYIFKRFPKES